MTRFAFAARLAAAGAMLVLAGCASQEPLDYLPEGQAYVLLNMAEVRNDAGAKRLMDVFQKLSETPTQADSMAERMYFSIAGASASAPSVYGVMIGREGFADQALADLKAAGGSEGKLAGRKAVVGKQFSLSPISKRAVLYFTSETDLVKMIDTSKRKSSGATETSLFRRAQLLSTEHGLAITFNVGTALSAVGPGLEQLARRDPKGAEALKQAEALEVTLDWDEQPTVRATLTCPEAVRPDLAALLNSLLGQVKQLVQMARMAQQAQGIRMTAAAALIEKLEAKPGRDGVELTLDFPKEEADALLARMESMVQNLPRDPDERAKALRAAFQQGVQ